MEKSYSVEDMTDKINGDIYLIKANMEGVDEMFNSFIRAHEAKLRYDREAITKALLFYHTHYDVRKELISGHWTGLALRGKEAYFFDSLGIFPDDQLNKINPMRVLNTTHSQRHVGKQLHKLALAGYRIHYNPTKFQKDAVGVNTCGRYVSMFLQEAINHPDPYKYMIGALQPYKKKSKYYDEAIVNYKNNRY